MVVSLSETVNCAGGAWTRRLKLHVWVEWVLRIAGWAKLFAETRALGSAAASELPLASWTAHMKFWRVVVT